jgi:hypothetical protein
MYRVQWIQAALDELAAIWVDADSALRAAITAAAHKAEQEFRADPERISESREEAERVAFVPPLGFEIVIDFADGIVWVGHVWLIRRRGTEQHI